MALQLHAPQVDLLGQPLPAPRSPRQPLAPPPPIGRTYGCLLIDLPWTFELRSEAGEGKAPQAKYDCWSSEELATLWPRHLNIDWICLPDCGAVFWTTWPMLQQSFRVIEGWGFTYSTGGSWHKRTARGKYRVGPGYRLRSASEPFLVATRGRPPIKSRNALNALDEVAREHSRKPDKIYALCEALFDGPYLEICARQQAPGWDAWGDQVGLFGFGS
jgi:N6-adenosine-specific RNA methylase IME4